MRGLHKFVVDMKHFASCLRPTHFSQCSCGNQWNDRYGDSFSVHVAWHVPSVGNPDIPCIGDFLVPVTMLPSWKNVGEERLAFLTHRFRGLPTQRDRDGNGAAGFRRAGAQGLWFFPFWQTME